MTARARLFAWAQAVWRLSGCGSRSSDGSVVALWRELAGSGRLRPGQT